MNTALKSEKTTLQLKALPLQKQWKTVEDLVMREVRETLSLASYEDIQRRSPLKNPGLNSLMAVELSNRLSIVFERKMPTTLTFDYPTADDLLHYIAGKILELTLPRAHRSGATQRTAALSDSDLDEEIELELHRFSTLLRKERKPHESSFIREVSGLSFGNS